MASIKTKVNLFELASRTNRLHDLDALEIHSLVVGSIDKEGKYITAGWLKSLNMEGDIVVATAYPVCEDDCYDRTIYNPRVVDRGVCPRCVLEDSPTCVERILGCDETYAWTTRGKVLIRDLSLIVKAKED